MSSTTQHQIMESSLATLGRLELTPSPAAVGVNLGPRLSGGPPGKERSGQPPLGTQPPSHLNGCVPLSHQVAGHKYGVDKVGILQHPDGTVLKQLQPPPRGPREMQFYSMVYSDDCCDPCLLDLQNHLPKYYGTWSSPDSPNDLYLKLEDVTRRFVKPCIMDVKLGQRSYDPFASQEKREQQIRKYPLMEEIGFLVLGMRVYKVGSDSFDSYDQHYGRGLVKDTIKDGLSKFFHNGLSLRRDAVSASILKVQRILGWFQSQRQLAFYASSLLFVYEGLPSSSFSSTSPALLLSTPVNGPLSDRTSVTSSGAGANIGVGGEGRKRQEMKQEVEGQEEEVAEYNNNNIRVAVPLDYSLATMYANHRKGAGNHHHHHHHHQHHHHHHHCTKGHIHGNSDVTMVTKDDVTAVNNEDNSAWKRDEPQQPNGNGIQLEEEDEETEEEEEEEERKKVSEGETRDTMLEQRGKRGEVEVRMIDFAHVFPSDSHDRGYVYGLKHLLTVLEEILRDGC